MWAKVVSLSRRCVYEEHEVRLTKVTSSTSDRLRLTMFTYTHRPRYNKSIYRSQKNCYHYTCCDIKMPTGRIDEYDAN